jgi:hypothetical protein
MKIQISNNRRHVPECFQINYLQVDSEEKTAHIVAVDMAVFGHEVKAKTLI